MNIPENIADSLTVRCLFCKKITVASDQGWITQPYPVLAMLTKGQGEVIIADPESPVRINTLMDPYYMHAYLMRNPIATEAAGFEALVIHFSVEVLGGVALMNFYDIPLTYTGQKQQQIRDLMFQLFEVGADYEIQDLVALAQQKQILLELFAVLIRDARPKKKGPLLNTEEYGCLAAVTYLKEHYTEPFDLERLLDLCHFSQAHFFRLFKKLTGVTPKQYQKDRRIEEAQKLLLTTSRSVAEIGERVGWHDQFHFSRIFKARTGYSPRQFKDQFKLASKLPSK